MCAKDFWFINERKLCAFWSGSVQIVFKRSDQIRNVSETMFPVSDQIRNASETMFPVSDQIRNASETMFPVSDKIRNVSETMFPISDQIPNVSETIFPASDQIPNVPETMFPISDQFRNPPDTMFGVPHQKKMGISGGALRQRSALSWIPVARRATPPHSDKSELHFASTPLKGENNGMQVRMGFPLHKGKSPTISVKRLDVQYLQSVPSLSCRRGIRG